MATNLRLRKDAEDALRAEAERTGRTQQELIRDAVDAALGLGSGDPHDRDGVRLNELRRRGITPARLTFREATRLIDLPKGITAAGVLDRDDRLL